MGSSTKQSITTAATSASSMVKDVYGDASKMLHSGFAGASNSDYFKDKISGK